MAALRVPCVAAVLRDTAGRVLLIRRDDRPGLEFAGWWTLPGGLVEAAETPGEAVRREVLEELNLSPALQHWLTYDRPHHRRIDGRAVTIVQHVYTASITDPGAIVLGEGQRCDWFAPAAWDTLSIAYGFADLLRRWQVADNRA